MNVLKDESKRSRGLFGPRTREPKDFVLWTPIAEVAWWIKKVLFPLFLSGTGKQANWHIFRFRARRLKAARPDALHPVKICEIGPGKSRLTERCFIPGSQRLPGIDQVIIGGLSLARFRIFSLCPKAFYIPSPAQHTELPKLSPPHIFARSGSRDEPPMTACGGNLIGGEIKRNEQSPLWGVATIEAADNRPWWGLG